MIDVKVFGNYRVNNVSIGPINKIYGVCLLHYKELGTPLSDMEVQIYSSLLLFKSWK